MSQHPKDSPAIADGKAIEHQISLMQRDLDSLRQQLVDTQRLATIGTIASVIAHEFNNLLTPIVTYAQFALQSAQGPTPDMEIIRKALTKSFTASTKAGKICQSMLALARGQSSGDEIAIQKLIDETLTVLARDPQKDNISLRVQVQPGLLVKGDPVQLEQVLLNLLINARQAMLGRGGSLTIRAAAADDASEARIQVSDTGSGIPEKYIGRIFEPFFSTKGTAVPSATGTRAGEPGGTGLGLAICKQIIEHHRGRIEVASELGKGTTFTIHLPLAKNI